LSVKLNQRLRTQSQITKRLFVCSKIIGVSNKIPVFQPKQHNQNSKTPPIHLTNHWLLGLIKMSPRLFATSFVLREFSMPMTQIVHQNPGQPIKKNQHN